MPSLIRRNIILIGFSFTGKSTVGKMVAERLGWKFVDLDQEIARKAGKTVPEIFAGEGEASFRLREGQSVKECLAKERQVVATGGGAVISEENRNLMKRSGLVVCLEARPETIYERLLKDVKESPSPEDRPLLAGNDPLARITAMKEQRRPFYQIAHLTVNTDGLSVTEVAASVIKGWEDRKLSPGAGVPSKNTNV